MQVGRNLGINFADPGGEFIDHLPRLDLARRQPAPEFRNGQAHHDCSMMRGTTMRLFSLHGRVGQCVGDSETGRERIGAQLIFEIRLAQQGHLRNVDLGQLADVPKDVAELLLEDGNLLGRKAQARQIGHVGDIDAGVGGFCHKLGMVRSDAAVDKDFFEAVAGRTSCEATSVPRNENGRARARPF